MNKAGGIVQMAKQEAGMIKSVIRSVTLAIFVMALMAAPAKVGPMIAPPR